MNPNRTEFLAAWIVALALIAAMAVHTFLPKTPPRFEPGVTDASQPRPPALAREVPPMLGDPDLPLFDLGDPVLPPEERRGYAGPQRGSENLPVAPSSARPIGRTGA